MKKQLTTCFKQSKKKKTNIKDTENILSSRKLLLWDSGHKSYLHTNGNWSIGPSSATDGSSRNWSWLKEYVKIVQVTGTQVAVQFLSVLEKITAEIWHVCMEGPEQVSQVTNVIGVIKFLENKEKSVLPKITESSRIKQQPLQDWLKHNRLTYAAETCFA